MRLPPFSALVALEAAYRHRSYSRAADELHVTHGAVSQQIRKLEEDLGAALFRREGNGMVPTPTARRLAEHVAEALSILKAGVESARQTLEGPLVVSATAAFASRWLVTRLARLAADTGEADLQLRIEDRKADLRTDGVDIALRFGRGPWADVESIPLLGERLFPVCSPGFLEKHPMTCPADLLTVPLLRHTGVHWAVWFRGMGLEPPAMITGLAFDDTSVMLDAAAQGIGVALAREGLSERDLRDGRLVRPFPGEVEVETGHHVVWRADAPRLTRILKVRDWLLAEVGREA
ncbi:LysR family transcriptional regulator [Caulobacter sp. D4A]|uniref:LysR substrate-binding domain-containing protein n=1 Tax=unclassified Caulobacter TaxID=2648921 RepID=UPI000D73D0D0|nr:MULTISPECIES: LysR substrate-binding domain-containing protein [unclassified Caulobacter]PXA82663.1 LysR family transcriptional regulator [Caulobacter sp. D4A]PXA96073.1 LysR family transcriptional regulator [Caulobacter sp. D5]